VGAVARYTTTIRSTSEKVDNDYRVRVVTTGPNYGGLRWWFICPITGRRARVLNLPGSGGTVFGSRQVWGLGYRSQRASPEDRAVERSLKARKTLGVDDQNMLDMPYCPRPKWMRRRTHRRLVGVIRDAHAMQMRYMARRWPGMEL
jgi:hypothetical protein